MQNLLNATIKLATAELKKVLRRSGAKVGDLSVPEFLIQTVYNPLILIYGASQYYATGTRDEILINQAILTEPLA